MRIRHIFPRITVVKTVAQQEQVDAAVAKIKQTPDPYLLALRLALRQQFMQLSPDQRDRLFELRSFLRIAFDNHEPETTIRRRLEDFDTLDDDSLEQIKQQVLALPQWTVTS